MTTQKQFAFCIGMSYVGTTNSLQGTVVDALHVGRYLREVGFVDVKTVTDERGPLSRTAFVALLKEFAKKTRDQDSDLAVLYYSGHGTAVQGMERPVAEPEDECLVASDCIVVDNEIKRILDSANPKTRILFIADCCNSGTIGDYCYEYKSPSECVTNTNMAESPCKVIVLTGCTDTQTSQEGYVDWLRKDAPTGFLTGVLLRELRRAPALRRSALKTFGAVFETFRTRFPGGQTPQLNCSFRLTDATRFL